jgi:hypothetical protein
LELRRIMIANQLLSGAVLSSSEVILFYSEKPEFFILPNGTLFLSEALLEKTLKIGGLAALSFLILHEMSHLVKSHLRANLIGTHKLGDLRRQLFLFTNQYTGFDALFVDYFTNTRYTLDQEGEADLVALKLMSQISGHSGSLLDTFTPEQYKEVLKVIDHSHQASEESKLSLPETSSN